MSVVPEPAVSKPESQAGSPNTRTRRTVIASLVGTTVEMYDFVLYGSAAAVVFAPLFFPQADPLVGTIAAFATFGVGFIARPVGGVIFGNLGDRIGRKQVLVLTMIGMGIASTLIGLLPTYETIGVAAPIALVALRLLQGVAMGGEQGGAFVLAAEADGTSSTRRGFLGSWPGVGMAGGLVLASLIFGAFARLEPEAFLSWGWRVPFLLSLVLVAIALIIRLGIPETSVFKKAQSEEHVSRFPLGEMLRSHWRKILLIVGMKSGETAAFFLIATFSVTYGVQFVGLASSDVLGAVLLAALVEMITLPLWGALSDRLGRRPVMIFGALFMAAFSVPFFLLLNTGNISLYYIALAIAMGLGHGPLAAPAGAFFAELFPTKVRLSGVSVGVQLTAALAGGFTPLIATALLASTGNFLTVAGYIAALAVISLIATILTRETNSRVGAVHLLSE
ncbi:MAG: MFS transporter [Microbacterium sp.]|uniref:MFS transporter n=1 Tax=Microbacterium sp. TaxID=51671 RepID=UPI002715D0AA|nr:MFS transporter [Microbacterium sp.]MDO8383846.1 MFS transporter [Microbacterium sp.]